MDDHGRGANDANPWCRRPVARTLLSLLALKSESVFLKQTHWPRQIRTSLVSRSNFLYVPPLPFKTSFLSDNPTHSWLGIPRRATRLFAGGLASGSYGISGATDGGGVSDAFWSRSFSRMGEGFVPWASFTGPWAPGCSETFWYSTHVS